MSRPDLDTPYWSQDASALAAALESGPGGLSSDRAAAQLALVGPNSVEDATTPQRASPSSAPIREPARPHTGFRCGDLSGAQQWVDAAIILAIVLGSSLLSFFQEYRASTAVEELKRAWR
jgi:Mg2+-importing ATPase